MEFGEPPPKPNNLPSMHDLVMRDMAERKQFGWEKYKSLLQPFNGRDPLKDLYEEILDAAVYIRQAMWERDNPAPFVFALEGEPDRLVSSRQEAAAACTHPLVQMGSEAYCRERTCPNYLHRPADKHEAELKVKATNCYCGGPEEIYPHVFGKGQHCRGKVEGGK